MKVDAQQFYDYFTEGNWIDSEGKHVKNWKQKLLTWSKFSNKAQEKPKKETNFNNYEQRDYDDLDKFYANKGG